MIFNRFTELDYRDAEAKMNLYLGAYLAAYEEWRKVNKLDIKHPPHLCGGAVPEIMTAGLFCSQALRFTK